MHNRFDSYGLPLEIILKIHFTEQRSAYMFGVCLDMLHKRDLSDNA